MPNEFITRVKQLIKGSLDDPKLTRFTGITIRIRCDNEEVTINYKAYGEDEEDEDEH